MGVKFNSVRDVAGIFKIEIDLQEAYSDEVPEEKEYYDSLAGAKVTIRELTTKESSAIVEDRDLFAKNLKDMILEHTFENDDGEPTSNQAVAEMILKSGTLYGHVVEELQRCLPLLRKNREKSKTSPTP